MKDEDVERLFRTYNTALVRYLTRRLGDRDWAEEVAQEWAYFPGPKRVAEALQRVMETD